MKRHVIKYCKLDIKKMVPSLPWCQCNEIIRRFEVLKRNDGWWGRQTPDCQLAKAFIDVMGLDVQTETCDDEIDTFTPPGMADIIQDGEVRPVSHDEQMVGVAKELMDFAEKTCPYCHKVCTDKAALLDHVRARHAHKFQEYIKTLEPAKKNEW